MTRSLAHLNRALQAAFGTQELAAACGCSENSARRYRNGYAVPHVVLLARLMRQSRSLAMAFWEYVGLDDASLDAEAARLRTDYAELQQELAAVHAEFQRYVAAHSGVAEASPVSADPGAVAEGSPPDAPGPAR